MDKHKSVIFCFCISTKDDVTHRLRTGLRNATNIHTKSNKENQDASGNQKNFIQEQTTDMENRQHRT